MEYETFKKVIVERLKTDIPDPKQISIQTVYKNNGLILDGLVIMEGSCNISPTLYLNYYYESYQKGSSFQSIYQTILSSYQQNKPEQNIDVRFFTRFEYTRSKLAFRIVNYEKNRSLLKDVPYIPFLDLAIVFYCLIPLSDEIGNATILIHNSHLHYWKITPGELYQIARANTRRILPPRLNNIGDMLRELSAKQPLFPPLLSGEDSYPMFILTNRMSLYGAACILYENLLQEYAMRADTDFYILPSSVHEVILIPASGKSCRQELSDLVREVNSSQLQAEEILSDHAYYYSRETDEITM